MAAAGVMTSASAYLLDAGDEAFKEKVHEMAKQVMHLDELDLDEELMDAGMDSIESVDFRIQLEKAMPGAHLPAALVMEHPTVNALAAFLLKARSKLKLEEKGQPTKSTLLLDGELQDPNGEVVLPSDFPAAVQLEHRRGDGQERQGAVLLTGATGFLGAHIAWELLEATREEKQPAKLLMVIRASSEAEGLKRIADAFGEYDLPLSETDRLRIEVLPTQDLSLPNLGLNVADGLEHFRAAGVHTIIHNAAMVNWIRSYDQLRAANALTTLSLLSYAAQLGAKFGYVSSISTLPLANPENCIDETCDNSWSKLSVLNMSGYSQTKWVSEQLCFAACKHGVSVTIFRMPFITGSTRTGYMNVTDSPARIVTSIVQLGEAPVSVQLDCVAVDVVARVCARVSLRPRTTGVNPCTGELVEDDRQFCVVHISMKFGKLGMEKIVEQLRLCGYQDIRWVNRTKWVNRAMAENTAAAPIQVFDRLFNRPALINSMLDEHLSHLGLREEDMLEVSPKQVKAWVSFLQSRQALPKPPPAS